MNVERFIASRILRSGTGKGNISGPIVKIGVTGIALGVAVMLITVGIVLGFKEEIIARITGLTTHIAVTSVNVNSSNEPEPISMGDDTLQSIRALPFVSGIQRTVIKNGLLKAGGENEGVLLKGVDADYDFSFVGDHLVAGRLPRVDSVAASRDILVSESLVKRMGVKVGDKVLIHFLSQHPVFDSTIMEPVVKTEHRSRKFTICGIFKTDFADFDDKLSFVDLRELQRINFWPPRWVGGYEIRVKNFADVDTCNAMLSDMLGYGYQSRTIKEIYYNIFIWLEKLDINGIIVVVLMVVVAAVNMITALLILILERTNMVGLLKALGMRNLAVRRIFMIVSLRLTLRGMLWGNLAGLGLCLVQKYFELATLDSATYYVDHVAVSIHWPLVLALNAGVIVLCAAMLVLPTVIITRLTPVRTLKFD